MHFKLKHAPNLTQRLRLTPQMRLAINLLQMPLVKLKEFITKQAEENPLLEIENARPSKEVNYDFTGEEDQNYKENLITKPSTLQDHLLLQLQLLADSDNIRKIGEMIIANINDDGYLKYPIEDIKLGSNKTTQTEVKKVLALIQTFDPVGVGARDLRECLLLQIKTKGEEKFLPADRQSLEGQIIDKYLTYLERKRFEFIAKKLKVPVERIEEAIKKIARLEPKPGRSFNTEIAVRLIPDVIVRKNNAEYELVPNDWELPSVNLNPKYKKMLRQKDITKDTKKYLKERLAAAKFLINAINNRKETIKKVAEAICYIQKDFLDNGMQDFKPMTLSQIAHLVDKHKSTVSRTVNNKYLQTPDGIFELRHFLNSGVKQKNGEFYSSRAIKSKIKELIENEPKENSLTDQEIVNLLEQEGISISRRTITKYRNQLKILSSQSRR